jgi:hypothetical protein
VLELLPSKHDSSNPSTAKKKRKKEKKNKQTKPFQVERKSRQTGNKFNESSCFYYKMYFPRFKENSDSDDILIEHHI